jgi:hypothetical protein
MFVGYLAVVLIDLLMCSEFYLMNRVKEILCLEERREGMMYSYTGC